jgi:hypothetical protein
MDYWAVIGSEEEGQFPADIDSKSRKITMGNGISEDS